METFDFKLQRYEIEIIEKALSYYQKNCERGGFESSNNDEDRQKAKKRVSQISFIKRKLLKQHQGDSYLIYGLSSNKMELLLTAEKVNDKVIDIFMNIERYMTCTKSLSREIGKNERNLFLQKLRVRTPKGEVYLLAEYFEIIQKNLAVPK